MVTPEVAPPEREAPPAASAAESARDDTAGRLSRPLRDQGRIARRLGLTGSLLIAISALGSGAFPVPNPLNGLRVLGLPGRNVTASIAVTYAGLGMVVLAWLWIGRMLTARGAVAPAPEKRELIRTGLLWAVPLALAPPMFTKDIYSYLAQSATLARGIDPYVIGPAQALGVGDPLVSGIPTVWRDTPAPYGPLFLGLGRVITAISGENAVLGVLEHRALALCGVGLIVWMLPKLARRAGLDPGLVLWLGAANPLVLFHLVSGIHNESLMIGLMLVGLHLALGPDEKVPPPWRWLLGAVFIVSAASVKLPALLALGFVGVYLVRRRGGGVRDWAVVGGALTAVAGVVFTAYSVGTGLGFNWLKGLSAPGEIRSWMSVSTDLGLLSGQIGKLAGLGDHTDSALSLARLLGGIAFGLVCLWLLFGCLRGRVEPIVGVGAGLGAVVLLGPVVHPWYLLWAVIPLTATSAMPHYRRAVLGLSAVLALVVPPTGADFIFRAFQLPLAIIAGMVVFAVALLWVRRALRAPARGPGRSPSLESAP